MGGGENKQWDSQIKLHQRPSPQTRRLHSSFSSSSCEIIYLLGHLMLLHWVHEWNGHGGRNGVYSWVLQLNTELDPAIITTDLPTLKKKHLGLNMLLFFLMKPYYRIMSVVESFPYWRSQHLIFNGIYIYPIYRFAWDSAQFHLRIMTYFIKIKEAWMFL